MARRGVGGQMRDGAPWRRRQVHAKAAPLFPPLRDKMRREGNDCSPSSQPLVAFPLGDHFPLSFSMEGMSY